MHALDQLHFYVHVMFSQILNKKKALYNPKKRGKKKDFSLFKNIIDDYFRSITLFCLNVKHSGEVIRNYLKLLNSKYTFF